MSNEHDNEKHDNEIEVICILQGPDVQYDVEQSTSNGHNQYYEKAEQQATQIRAGSRRRKVTANNEDKLITAKQRRIKLVVIIIALLLILASVILVAVTLSMSGHIDDMGESSSIVSCTVLLVLMQ